MLPIIVQYSFMPHLTFHYPYFSRIIFKDINKSHYFQGLVWLYEEKESEMKIIEKLRGNMVIYIYPGAHKFSLFISHLS